MANKVYVASASSDLAETYEQSDVVKFMNALRDQGFEITFDWAKNIFEYNDLYEGLEVLSDDARNDLIKGMDNCLNGIDEADVVIVYCSKGINDSMGAQREIGYTMGFDKKVFYYRTEHTSINGYSNTISHPFVKLTESKNRSVVVKDTLFNFIDMCEVIRNL